MKHPFKITQPPPEDRSMSRADQGLGKKPKPKQKTSNNNKTHKKNPDNKPPNKQNLLFYLPILQLRREQ